MLKPTPSRSISKVSLASLVLWDPVYAGICPARRWRRFLETRSSTMPSISGTADKSTKLPTSKSSPHRHVSVPWLR
ncbi:hypothetical protein C8R45DRAFT_995874 [Mycena sanguinolenta]|nr:hypothetical protein C8R45DRAFT_995874 [Mycena sanguinolenta]